MMSVIAELERLNGLRVAGFLSAEEFAAAKAAILSQTSPENLTALGPRGTVETVTGVREVSTPPENSDDAACAAQVAYTLEEPGITSSSEKSLPKKTWDTRALIASALIAGTLGMAGWSVLRDPQDVAPVPSGSYDENIVSLEATPPPMAAPPTTSGPASLEGVMIFENTATCEVAPALAEIFGNLVTVGPESEGWPISSGRPVRVAGFSKPLQPSFSNQNSMVHSALPISGMWHGLTVTQIGIEFVEGGDMSTRRFRFANDLLETLQILHRLGFKEQRLRGEDSFTVIAIRSDGDGTVLECTETWGDMG